MLALGGAACCAILFVNDLFLVDCAEATIESAMIKNPDPIARIIGAPSMRNYIFRLSLEEVRRDNDALLDDAAREL